MLRNATIIAGPNGVGKTTFAKTYLNVRSSEYISADEIALGLNPDDVERYCSPILSITNFWQIYKNMADMWSIYSNSSNHFCKVAVGEKDQVNIYDNELFDLFMNNVGD